MLADQILEFIRRNSWSHLKSKGIRGLTMIILEEYGGQVPAFPVDAHVHRLAHRWTLSTGKNAECTEADLKKLFPEDT